MTVLVKNSVLREAFRRGEKKALTEVYFAYAEHLFAMLSNGFTIHAAGKRILFKGYRESWRLEGAVQEIFSRAFADNARTAYDGLRPYKNYLFTIARNYVVDSYRRGSKAFVVMDTVAEGELDFAAAQGPKAPPSPERSAENRQLKEQVGLFMMTLDPDETALFNARFTEGMSVERVSETLERSEYWVKRNEKKLRKRFYLFMKERGYFDGFRYGGKDASMLVLLLLLHGASLTDWGARC
jgi:RNA polymerase sigma factor (sigma-70 family)